MKKHPTTHATVSRSDLPPLPAEVTRRVLAGLRSPMLKRQTIEALLAARAFATGFAQGADVDRVRRHVVDSHHAHWLRGYHAGQRAAAEAAARYLGDQLRDTHGAYDAYDAHDALDALAPCPRMPRANERTPTPRPRTRATSASSSPQLTLI